MQPAKPKIHKQIRTIEELAIHLQWALALELSTIPPYLCALYSIADNTTMAYQLIRSVVLEEMLHMMQVANLMNSIGASISLAAEFVPQYPSFMKHHAAGGPFIQLQALSKELVQDVFLVIEEPEISPKAPSEDDEFETIGQFYKAIELGFEYCVDKFGEHDVFGNDTGLQRSDTYFGSGGGKIFVVKDLDSAKEAVQEIMQQGEGAAFVQQPLPGKDSFVGINHYGMRRDQTYGPILGTLWDLSHYRKFHELTTGAIPLPATYPMLPNPAAEKFTNQTRKLAELFDNCFTLVLQALEKAFTRPSTPVDFYSIAFPVMRSILPSLAVLLMQTPIELDANPALGPTAGPGFGYRPAPLQDIVTKAEELLASPIYSLGTEYVQLWQRNLNGAVQVLRESLAVSERAAKLEIGDRVAG